MNASMSWVLGILAALTCSVWAVAATQWQGSGEQARFGLTAHPGHPAATQNRRFTDSPIDALIDGKARCRLCCQIPFRLDFDTITDLRITAIPQRHSRASETSAGSESTPMWFSICTISAPCLMNACDAHRLTADRARQHLVDAGNQHRPQVVRLCVPGRHGTCRHGTCRHGTGWDGLGRAGTGRHGQARAGTGWHGLVRAGLGMR